MYNWRIFLGGAASAGLLATGIAAPALASTTPGGGTARIIPLSSPARDNINVMPLAGFLGAGQGLGSMSGLANVQAAAARAYASANQTTNNLVNKASNTEINQVATRPSRVNDPGPGAGTVANGLGSVNGLGLGGGSTSSGLSGLAGTVGGLVPGLSSAPGAISALGPIGGLGL